MSMEVTKREVLFSSIIVLVMIAVGVFISGAIEERIQTETERYTTAVRIVDAGQFRYGMNTNFGNALVFGTLQAKEPVSFPELGGEYMIVRKVKERYTRHTRTVTTTDSKGNTKRKTEVYYTWDYVGHEEKRSDNVSFLGEEFDIRQFNLPHEEAIYLPNGGKYLYEWTVTRYYYEGLPSSFDATIHANLIKKDIGEGVDVFRDMTPDQVVESKLNGQNIPVISFWVLWLIFTGAVVYFFVGQENKWLEGGR